LYGDELVTVTYIESLTVWPPPSRAVARIQKLVVPVFICLDAPLPTGLPFLYHVYEYPPAPPDALALQLHTTFGLTGVGAELRDTDSGGGALIVRLNSLVAVSPLALTCIVKE
jgi:hypothetical protein